MGKLSDDESSSDSSSNEFLVPADQLDFNSSFFQVPAKKEQQKKTPNPKTKQSSSKKPTQTIKRLESSSDDDDDEFDCNQDDNQVSSAELLSQVLKNLENANKPSQPLVGESKPSSLASGSAQLAKDDLSKEINDLLMMGESQASTSKVDMEVDVKQEDIKEEVKSDGYVIPEKGVQIHLPGESLIMDKKKKKQQDLQKMLQNKINQRIRKTQVYAHKTSLLCWLAYGFHLNNLANDPDLLGITLSLVSPQNYPKERPDLKYLEKFTIWFGSLFKMCDEHKNVVFDKDLLMKRVSEKKIFNYIELILLYIATIRGMGMNCRLVISLQPPRLKPKQDQLFKIPALEDTKNVKKEDDSEDDDDDEIEDVTDEPTERKPAKRVKRDTEENDGKSSKKKTTKKPSVHRSIKAAASTRKLETKEKSVSPAKVIPQNSSEAAKAAKEEAKKKAAAILKGKTVESAKNYVVIIEDSKSLEEFSKKFSKTEQSKNSKDTQSNKISNNETKEKDNKVNVKENTSSKNTRSRRNLNTVENDTNSDYEENNETVKKKESTSNTSNKRTRHNLPNKILATTKGISDDNDAEEVDNKGEKNLSIAKKLSLRVKEKKETNPINKKRDKSNIEKKATRKRKHSNSYKEVSDDEEEKDSSSEYSANERSDSSADEFSSDYEFEETKPKKKNLSTKDIKKKESTSNKKKVDKSVLSKFTYKSKNPRKLISSDDESVEPKKKGYNLWVEVYVESEESWISISVLDQKIHCVSTLYKKATQPVLYIIAWNSAGTVKDVTRRYCPHWLTDTRKKRVDEKWWKETLKPWKEKCSAISRAEDEQLLQRELEQPLPKSVSECKGHPLYVLQRHLLKFEALYPPDVVPLGHLKTGEAIYSRHCVHTLYSRETWVKRARVVKPAQEAYKVVKSMPKYDKLSGQKIKDQPLELFGKWQTTPYEPPVAKDGKVPRNEYGNVDLFKMCMLPKGCVYIDLPALNRIARKLNIDCAPACVGFNFGCRGALPAFQGFVVCEEYEDTLREAWEEEQVLAQKRATEKREKRIYGNWKKLIKGLLIREKLAAKYRFGGEEDNAEEDEDEEEEERIVNKKSAVKKVTTATTSAKPKGKRGRPKQEPGSVIKKLKK